MVDGPFDIRLNNPGFQFVKIQSTSAGEELVSQRNDGSSAAETLSLSEFLTKDSAIIGHERTMELRVKYGKLQQKFIITTTYPDGKIDKNFCWHDIPNVGTHSANEGPM